MPSKINHPKHYNVGDIETIDYLESLGIAEDFCIGNAIKYLSRYKHKNGDEDLEKAKWYIERVLNSRKVFKNVDNLVDAMRYATRTSVDADTTITPKHHMEYYYDPDYAGQQPFEPLLPFVQIRENRGSGDDPDGEGPHKNDKR